MQSFSLIQAANFMGQPHAGNEHVLGVCVDSRLLKKGDLFFALPGARVDGHSFLQEAAYKNAAAAVVQAGYNGDAFGLPLIRVQDPLEALQSFARHVLEQRKVRIVGVTGSVGKTTTKDFIATLLKAKFRVTESPGNSNSQTGLPLNILNLTKGDEEVLILEMGMTHPGNIARLVQIAPPEVSVITTVDMVHIANFESLEAIAQAKAEILSHPRTKLGIIHYDIENYASVLKAGSCGKLSFSVSSNTADYFLEDMESHLRITDRSGEKVLLDNLKVPGKHNQHNFLAAAAVARAFGMDWDEIKCAMGSLSLHERRLQFIEKNGVLFVNDSYNAALVSMKAALNALPKPKLGCKSIAVLGSMLELGKYSAECHRQVGEHALQRVDRVLCFGQECAPLCESWNKAGRPAELFMDRGELVNSLRGIVEPGDVVLLKGSKSKEMWKVLEEL